MAFDNEEYREEALAGYTGSQAVDILQVETDKVGQLLYLLWHASRSVIPGMRGVYVWRHCLNLHADPNKNNI